MRKLFLLLAAILFATTGMMFAQSADNEDEVVKIDHWNRNAYRPNEVIVHFKEDGAVQMRAPRRAKFQTTAVSAVDQLFATLGVDSVEELMPRTGTKPMPKKVRAYNGKDIEPKPLGKLYRLMLSPDKQQSVYQVIDTLKSLEEVDFAEPNYLVYTLALPYDDSIPTFDSATYVQEPLYSQQWGLEAINLPSLWNKPKRTSKRPVIAILDTGVDIEHPDLAANIWTNNIESNGIARQDDDANGFKDDIHGWDFINQTGIIRDFNGHGTHCAGIAAAVGDNGIGITGANPDAYIMPVSVMQSNGTGDIATIIKGIDYASANGADVISMSFGSYAYSIAEEQALGRAYANSVLVAAAGNDRCVIYPPSGGPMFPAGFTFVLGVEASKNGTCLAEFSNYDPDGPIYSEFSDEQQYNYELRAPGVQILSTFPGGRYKYLNGTSMACPLVAGAVSRLIQCKETLSQELLFGDLIHTHQRGYMGEKCENVSTNGNIDIIATYNITVADRYPEITLVSANFIDTVNGDGDLRADAGETIEFYPIIKNAWGQAENIRFWMKTGYYNQGDWVWDDTTLVQHLQDTAYFGKPLSSYAKATSVNPWRMSISPNCADRRIINLTVFAICDNMVDTLRQTIAITVENGVELGGVLTKDLTLYPNVHYIVNRNLVVPNGKTLIIKPGVKLLLKEEVGISVESSAAKIIAQGKPDSLIYFLPYSLPKEIHERYSLYLDTVKYAYIENGYYLQARVVEDCDIRSTSTKEGSFVRCNFSNSGPSPIGATYTNSNIISCGYGDPPISMYSESCKSNNIFHNHFLNAIDNVSLMLTSRLPGGTVLLQTDYPHYIGSSVESIARKTVMDIDNDYGYQLFDLSNMPTRPIREAHGIVWKVVIDGYDAQDEFDQLPPLGVERHKCEVYFSRPMDTIVTPYISYGVRSPYTQHAINESGGWSADSTIYTAYFTIDGKTVSDGLNRLYVAAAQDDEHFEIPLENFRFNMEIAAAGSMSTGLMAEAGLGKVTLTWETDEEDFDDLLGYNIYRWTHDTIKWNRHWEDSCGCYVPAGWRIDTICINTTLIDASDSAYIDYDVVPGKAYYYVIRQMTTSLENYDLSNPVTATPLTTIKGDANGSMSVDVADVITEVNYITHQNPQPFIFEAADVNSDNAINIFDVVGTINIILHPEAQSNAVQENNALYYIENGILYVESDAVLGGVQFTFAVDSPHVFTPLDALNGFEMVSEWTNSENYLFMAYSMSGKTIGVGKNALLQIGDAELIGIALSDTQGHNVNAIPRASTALDGTVFMPNSSKYIQDGNFFIKLGDRIYNAIGTLIK